MENRDVGANEFVMPNSLNERIGLGNGQGNRLAPQSTASRRLCVAIVQRRQAENRNGVHSRDSFDVAVGVLQRNLSGIDERQSGGAETDCDFSP